MQSGVEAYPTFHSSIPLGVTRSRRSTKLTPGSGFRPCNARVQTVGYMVSKNRSNI